MSAVHRQGENNQTTEDIGKPISTVCAHTVHHALCQPFLVDHTNNGKARKIDRPIPTQTTKEHLSLITPLILGQQGGAMCQPANKPCPTIATAGAVRVIIPFVVDNANGGIVRSSDKPINTVTVRISTWVYFPCLKTVE